MEFKTIKYQEPEAGIGFITLNRPDRLNALGQNRVKDIHTV